MKNDKTLFLAAALLISGDLTAATASYAANNENFMSTYIHLYGGLALSPDSKGRAFPGTTPVSFNRGHLYGIEFMGKKHGHFRRGINRLLPDGNEIRLSTESMFGSIDADIKNVNGHVHANIHFSNFINAYYFPNIQNQVLEPFIGTGLGVGVLSIDPAFSPNDRNQWQWAYQLIAGTNANINDKFSLSARYKYTSYSKPFPLLERLGLHSFLIGFSFHAWDIAEDRD